MTESELCVSSTSMTDLETQQFRMWASMHRSLFPSLSLMMGLSPNLEETKVFQSSVQPLRTAVVSMHPVHDELPVQMHPILTVKCISKLYTQPWDYGFTEIQMFSVTKALSNGGFKHN